jgi:thiol-disulfide isomerase/thioredoxin
MKRYIILIYCVILVTTNYAQPQQLRSLVVGDIVPDIEISNMINNSSATQKLFDFKSDLLIIDFWATWCGPCVASFPKLEFLQKKFGEKLRILSVTN